MPHFTTTDILKFRSYMVGHGVDASTAKKVANKVQRKAQRNKPFTSEEDALIDGFFAKAANDISGGGNAAQKVNPYPVKFDRVSLKRGFSNVSLKLSDVSFKYFRPAPPGKLNTRIWGDPHISNKAQMLSNKSGPLSNKAQMLSNKSGPLSNKAKMLSNKAQKVSVYSPGTVRQLAYKVASS